MRALRAAPVLPVAALAAAAAVLASSIPAPDRALYEQGRQAVLEMRWKDAEVSLARLLETYPGSPFSDDALYWRAFARAEAGGCASAYADLTLLEERYPGSPRVAAGRALRVRCAGALLATDPDDPKRADYARLIAEATRRDALPARLSAAEVLLAADPVEGARAVRSVAAGLKDRTLVEVVLDRHFGEALAVARPADPALPLGAANAVVLVRRPDGADALSLPEALRATRDESESAYPPRTRAAIEHALANIRQAGLRESPGGGREASRVVQIEDTEMHLYRGPEETVRILVLNRGLGYREDNVRVFVQRGGQHAELSARDAERMVEAGDTRTMGPRALRFVGSSLALIRLDLDSVAGPGGGR